MWVRSTDAQVKKFAGQPVAKFSPMAMEGALFLYKPRPFG